MFVQHKSLDVTATMIFKSYQVEANFYQQYNSYSYKEKKEQNSMLIAKL